jgi:hypothetical protein
MKRTGGCLVAVAFAPLLGLFLFVVGGLQGNRGGAEVAALGVFVFLCALPAVAMLVLVRKRPMNPALAVNILTAAGLLVTTLFYFGDLAWRSGYVEFSQGSWDDQFLVLVVIFPLWCVAALAINVALYLSKHTGASKLTIFRASLMLGIVILAVAGASAFNSSCVVTHSVPDGSEDTCAIALHPGVTLPTPTPIPTAAPS